MHRPVQPLASGPGRPGSRVFRLGRVRAFGLPRLRALPPRRRPSCRLPRNLSPWAVPAMEVRVSPNLACLSVPGITGLRVAPFTCFSLNAFDAVPGLPHALHRPALPAMELRVASYLASFGGADWPVVRLPRVPVLRYRRRSVPQVAPLRRSSGSVWWSPRLLRADHPPVLPLA